MQRIIQYFVSAGLIFLISIPSFSQINPRDLSFKVTKISGDSLSTIYEAAVLLIEIYDSNSGKFIQSLEHEMDLWTGHFLEIDTTDFEDVNFYGHEDLVLLSGYGAAGRNVCVTVYLFDTLENKFQYSDPLSGLINLSVNKEDKTIDENIITGGSSNYMVITYIFINNTPVVHKVVKQQDDEIETLYYENGILIRKETEPAW
jgi:hypothetical protein